MLDELKCWCKMKSWGIAKVITAHAERNIKLKEICKVIRLHPSMGTMNVWTKILRQCIQRFLRYFCHLVDWPTLIYWTVIFEWMIEVWRPWIHMLCKPNSSSSVWTFRAVVGSFWSPSNTHVYNIVENVLIVWIFHVLCIVRCSVIK